MVAKRQRKEKTHENRTKEGSRTRARPSGETKALLASPIYIGQAQEGKKKHIKKRSQNWALLFMPLGCIFLCLPNKTEMQPSCNTSLPLKLRCNWVVTLVSHFKFLLWWDRIKEITHSLYKKKKKNNDPRLQLDLQFYDNVIFLSVIQK